MKVKEQNVPELRFPGFCGEWRKDRVGNLCDFIVPGRNKPKEFNGNIPWITTIDIEHSRTVYFSKSGLAISKEEAKKVGSKIVPVNSIVISCVGEFGLVAVAGREIVLNQQLHVFIAKEEVNYRFLLYGVSMQRKYMERVATKTAVPYMNKDNCNSIPITFPPLPEQKKIASFLTAVDSKIEQLSRKKALLEQYKKGMMQKLFSQELRFKDEQGNEFPDWEVKPLGAHGKFKSGIGFSSAEQGGQDGVPFYKVSDMNLVGNEYSMTRSNNYVSSEQVHRLKYKPITEPSIIFAKVGAAIFLERKRIAENFLIDNNMMAFVPAINLLFMKYVFDMVRLSKFAQVGALPSYNGSDLETIKISIPKSPEEQQKIADFLSSIDKKINLISTELNHAQSFKKSLLQQMFI